MVGHKLNYIADIEAETVPLKFSPIQGFCAQYANELIGYLVEEDSLNASQCLKLFQSYKNLLRNLLLHDDQEIVQLYLRKFEFEVLDCLEMLYQLNLDKDGNQIIQSKSYFVHHEHGIIDPDQLLSQFRADYYSHRPNFSFNPTFIHGLNPQQLNQQQYPESRNFSPGNFPVETFSEKNSSEEILFPSNLSFTNSEPKSFSLLLQQLPEAVKQHPAINQL